MEAGGFFGGVLAGYLTDLIMKRASQTGKPSASARLPVATAMMLVVSLCLHGFRFHVDASTSQLFITSLGFLLGCALYGPIAIFGVMASTAAPTHLSGTSHAIVALAANGNCVLQLGKKTFISLSNICFQLNSGRHHFWPSLQSAGEAVQLGGSVLPPRGDHRRHRGDYASRSWHSASFWRRQEEEEAEDEKDKLIALFCQKQLCYSLWYSFTRYISTRLPLLLRLKNQ